MSVRARGERSVCIYALWRLPTRAAPVVLLFPERTRIPQAQSDALKLVGCLELENAELRREVVELALQIQELKERWR